MDFKEDDYLSRTQVLRLSPNKNNGYNLTEDDLLLNSKAFVATTIILEASLAIALIISFMYYFILLKFGNPDIKLVLVTMLGFILLSMAYISFGIMISSLTENQVIAAVITLVFSIIPLFVSYGTGIFSNLALINLFQKFPANVISLKEVVGLLSFTVMCITLTILVIQRRKCLK